MTYSPGSGIATESEPCRCAELDQLRTDLTTAYARITELGDDVAKAKERTKEVYGLYGEMAAKAIERKKRITTLTADIARLRGIVDTTQYTLQESRNALKLSLHRWPANNDNYSYWPKDYAQVKETYEMLNKIERERLAALTPAPEPDAGTDVGEVGG